MKRAEQFDDFEFTEDSPGYYAGLSTAPTRGWKLSTPWAYFILGVVAALVLESLFAFFCRTW